MDKKGGREHGGADQCPPQPCCCCLEPCDTCPPIKEDAREIDICGPETCLMLGHWDAPYVPPPLELGKGDKVNPMGESLGLAHSTNIVKTDLESSEHQQQRFASILKAYAKIYLLDEKKWNNEVIDTLLTEGEQLTQDSQDYQADPEEDVNILAYNANEIKVKREFDLDGSIFQIELGPKFYISDEMNQDRKERWNKFYLKQARQMVVGEEEGMVEEEGEEEEDSTDPDLPIQLLKKHLRAFFYKHLYGVIQFNDNRYLLVWKAYKVFFVLDFFGRRLNDLMTDHEAGVATMVVMKSINSLIYLMSKLSNLEENDVFNIREIKVVRLTGPDGRTFTQSYGWRKNQFEIINYDYAFLRSKLHLSMNRHAVWRNRSALPVGIAAIIASKIDHPAVWNEKVMDRIICYGVSVCKQCWQGCQKKDMPINLSEFPRHLKMGQFWVRYDLYPMKYEGLFKCVPNQDNNELTIAIQRAFDDGNNYLLLQVSNQMYAIWRKRNGFLYIFDPFRHKVIGYDLKPGEDPKTASLRMFCVFTKFMAVLNHILVQYTKTARFYLHVVKVRRIDKSLNEPTLDEETPSEDLCEEKEKEGETEEGNTKDDDIISLNEEICFEEDEIKCQELGIISDFEEEEEEIPISEYEEEVAPGEEEEAAPEELAPIVEAGSFHKGKRRRKRSKGKGKGKGKKSKGKKKKTAGDTGEEHVHKEKGPKEDTKKEDAKKKKHKETKKKEEKVQKDEKKAGDDQKEDECPKVEGGKAKKLYDRYMEQARCLADEFRLREPGKKEAICSEDPDHKMPPNYGAVAYDMVVVGSESGSFGSICKLLRSGFKHADRVYLMTPWSNYVVFRAWNLTEKVFFLFDGCTCNVNRFRYLDLSTGTSGLMSFSTLADIVNYIIDSCQVKCSIKENREKLIDDICNQFCV